VVGGGLGLSTILDLEVECFEDCTVSRSLGHVAQFGCM